MASPMRPKATWGTEPHAAKATWDTEPHAAEATWDTEPHVAKAPRDTEPHTAADDARRRTERGASAESVVRLEQVTKSYPGTPPVVALDRVDLSIDRGEMVAITGPSGSGKSTLLNIVGTLDRPTTGTVEIDGVDTTRMSDRAVAGLRAFRIGFVFQQFHLLESATALENVATGLLYRGVPGRRRKAAAREALERVGLGGRVHAKPGELSGGMRQRVAIARALVGEPAFVLADEPTGNLDSATSQEIEQLLFDLNREGSTIVVITHDVGFADRLPRQVSILDGRIESPVPAGVR